jgi:hypothetical protein
VVVNGEGGRAPVEITSCAERPIRLSAEGTRDPDGNSQLTYRWWQYREASGVLFQRLAAIGGADTREAVVVAHVTAKPAPNIETPPEALYHVVLSVTDDGAPPLTRYRRVLIRIPTAGTPAGDALGCTAGKGG